MTTISLRMDDQMKKELDEMCEAMGMNISTFYMIYTKKALRDRKIPFDIEAPADPFYSEQNMAQLRSIFHLNHHEVFLVHLFLSKRSSQKK